MARISTVIIAAAGGGAFGGALVGVVCWLVTRDIRPQAVIVKVPPIEVTQLPPDSSTNEWTHFYESGRGRADNYFVQTNSVSIAQSVSLSGSESLEQVSAGGAAVSAVNQPTNILNNGQTVRASSSTVNSYSLQWPRQESAASPAAGSIDDALSYALEAADPFAKQGFTVREDYWGGDLPAKGNIAIAHQLFKGSEYWFWAGTAADTGISVHVFDAKGDRADAEYWSKLRMGAARVAVNETGTYYLIVQFNPSVSGARPLQRTAWAMVYGFR
jgi:hypothetical protein